MLEQQDFELIRAIMREELAEKLDTRFGKFEEKLDKKIDVKLDTRFSEFEEKLDNKIDVKLDTRFEEFEEKLDKKMDTKLDVRLRESENLILEEVGRLHNITMKQMSTIQKKMDGMEQYYRINRLESDNTAMLLKITENLSRRVDRLETIIA